MEEEGAVGGIVGFEEEGDEVEDEEEEEEMEEGLELSSSAIVEAEGDCRLVRNMEKHRTDTMMANV